MENNEEISKTQSITYLLLSSEGTPIERLLSIDSDELQKTVLLPIYYCDMLKIKARTGDVVLTVMNWLYSKCYQVENIITKNWINIPYFEGYRLLAQMYAKEMIDTVEQNESSFFILKESGKKLCKEYLIQQ